MGPVPVEPRIVLIGGASHTGKSALAAGLCLREEWISLSTDSLGRHPGRPWRTDGYRVPKHVGDYYISHSAEELVGDLLCYQRSMWPTIQRIIDHHLAESACSRLVFEGSALLPDKMEMLAKRGARAICLTADADVLQQRVNASSGYQSATRDGQNLIDRFIERNQLFNQLVVEMSQRYGIDTVNNGAEESSLQATLARIGVPPDVR